MSIDQTDEQRAYAAGQHLHRLPDGRVYSHNHGGNQARGHDHVVAHLVFRDTIISRETPVVAWRGAIWFDTYTADVDGRFLELQELSIDE